MALCLQDNHFIEWAVSPQALSFVWIRQNECAGENGFPLLLVDGPLSCRMLHGNQSFASTALGLFCITPEAPWLLDSLILQVSQPQSLSPNQAGLWLVFFFFFLLLTKVHTVLNTKLQQMGAVLSRASEHYTWPRAVPLCAQQGWRQNILCPRVSPAWGPPETQHIRAEFLETPSICAGGEEQKARSSWSVLNV